MDSLDGKELLAGPEEIAEAQGQLAEWVQMDLLLINAGMGSLLQIQRALTWAEDENRRLRKLLEKAAMFVAKYKVEDLPGALQAGRLLDRINAALDVNLRTDGPERNGG